MPNLTEITQFCRLCLVKNNVNIPIFEDQSENGQIFVKISSCLPVTVTRDDDLPKNICSECANKLDVAYEFRKSTVVAEKQLRQWIDDINIKNLNDSSKEADDNQIIKEEPDDSFVAIPETITYESDKGSSSKTRKSGGSEPPPKRARRAAAMKRPVNIPSESDEDVDDVEPLLTKTEDSDSELDTEDHDPTFEDIPPTNVDQPGPSGVGKEGVEFREENIHSNYQCGVCCEMFPSKDKYLQHMNLFGELFTCCKCHMNFNTCTELYLHYEIHSTSTVQRTDEEEENVVEEIELPYEDTVETIRAAANVEENESNELLYILDDAHCVNEVVIEEDEQQLHQQQQQQQYEQDNSQHSTSDTVAIVNLEHGYMIPNVLDEKEEMFEEETIYEEEDGNRIIIRKQLPVFNKAGSSKRLYTQQRPRAPQPKRRHEVPDFSASNYVYIQANEEIDVNHFKCLRCEQLFISKFGFFRHIEKGKCYINNCDVCVATFTRNQEFYEHYVSFHTDRAICNFCFRTFMYEKNVKEHMLRHLDQFRHRCEECNKGFYTVREYRNHYKNRHMGIRHKCNICGRSFADEYYFKRHIATHAKAATILQINKLD